MKAAVYLAIVLACSAHAQSSSKLGNRLYGNSGLSSAGSGSDGGLMSAQRALDNAGTDGSGSGSPSRDPSMNAHRAYYSNGTETPERPTTALRRPVKPKALGKPQDAAP